LEIADVSIEDLLGIADVRIDVLSTNKSAIPNPQSHNPQ